uniref:Uncharacterized protein n=1 Tax=Oryza meridionalis TaxID=40149 RepID=A0A0E0D2V8_9ORYZ
MRRMGHRASRALEAMDAAREMVGRRRGQGRKTAGKARAPKGEETPTAPEVERAGPTDGDGGGGDGRRWKERRRRRGRGRRTTIEGAEKATRAAETDGDGGGGQGGNGGG